MLKLLIVTNDNSGVPSLEFKNISSSKCLSAAAKANTLNSRAWSNLWFLCLNSIRSGRGK